jgi:hypothetical protein
VTISRTYVSRVEQALPTGDQIAFIAKGKRPSTARLATVALSGVAMVVINLVTVKFFHRSVVYYTAAVPGIAGVKSLRRSRANGDNPPFATTKKIGLVVTNQAIDV